MQLVAKSDQSTGNSAFASFVLKSNDLVRVFVMMLLLLVFSFSSQDIQAKEKDERTKKEAFISC